MSKNVKQPSVMWCIHENQEWYWMRRIVSSKSSLGSLCSALTPYLQQCRETLTLPTMHGGRQRHHHTHSDRAGVAKDGGGGRKREGWGGHARYKLLPLNLSEYLPINAIIHRRSQKMSQNKLNYIKNNGRHHSLPTEACRVGYSTRF